MKGPARVPCGLDVSHVDRGKKAMSTHNMLTRRVSVKVRTAMNENLLDRELEAQGQGVVRW